MKDPVGESLSLLGRMSRLKVQALALKERARETRRRLGKSINTKPPVAPGGGKGNE